MLGGGGQGRPCKFGMDCNKFKQGTCTFLHDMSGNMPNNAFQGGRGGRGGRGQMGHSYNKEYQSNQNIVNNNIPVGYNNQGGMQGVPKQNNYNQNNDGITQQFCRFFQIGQCKNGQGCKKPHEFTKGDILRRVLKTKDVPSNDIARLCVLNINGINYFTLRLGNVVTIFQYNSESGQINQLPQTFVLEYPDIHLFDAREKYIYFAYQNKNTSFSNIGFIDVTTKQRTTVDNAHKLKVTGLVHIYDNNNQPLVLSSSFDGTIKVWKIQGDKMVLNQQVSEAINNCFKTNTNIEMLFLTKQNISGSQVLAAGTSDNRLLFFIGSQMKFQQVVFQQPYNKVLSLKYVQTGPSWVAIAIVWSADASLSALIAVNLSTMQHEVIVQEQTQNNKRQLYSTIQKIGKLFLVANLNGLVTIYKVPDFKTKIGCIMHNNSLADMVCSTSMTSTNIQMLNLFILERMESNKEGSFSVFSLRE